MLGAAVEDFARCPGVDVVTLLDSSLLSGASDRWPANVVVHMARADAQEEDVRGLGAAADATLLIAPEFDGILAQHCGWVQEAGGRLLGPSAKAVKQTADKGGLNGYLRAQGIAAPPSVPLPLSRSPPWPPPWVCKPRDGAGSQATFVVRGQAELAQSLQQALAEGWRGSLILQPYVAGLPASVVCLVGKDRVTTLPAAQQRLSQDGRFRYEGGSLPLPPRLDARAQRLAEQAARAVHGLFGCVGVDLVLGEPADGSGDAVIEINPRLTTSYVGLRRLAQFNLAEALLRLVANEPLPELHWRQMRMCFQADGTIVE
jgi:predicted ATP-grasp superfamily ATP-dependent carboligase